MSDLPDPLVPADVDLRDFAFMPLDVVRVRDSDLAAEESPEACWAALLLWCASWHQVPAGSIPASDQWQAKQAGYVARGRIDKAWDAVRAGALRNWVACSDGRLYHPVIAEKARAAWAEKQAQRTRTAAATAAREAKRKAEQEARDADRHGERRDARDDQRDVARDVHQGRVKGQGTTKKTPQPPKGGKPPVGLKAWIESLKATGEKPIPEGDPVFAYAERVGIPHDFLSLAWRLFRHRYLEQHPNKRYRDWRRVFRNAVEGNWLKVWYLDPATEQYGLTTVGQQAQRALAERSAA